MLTLEGLPGSFWNTSLLVLDPGEKLSLCWNLSISRWRLLWLSDFLVTRRHPSLCCLEDEGDGDSSALSWHSLLRRSINRMLNNADLIGILLGSFHFDFIIMLSFFVLI